MNTQPNLRPGAVIDGDTVVGQLPNGDWLLVAPASTFKRLDWGCYGERIGACGTGRENTDKMLAAGSPAAAYCRTGLGKAYDLPGKDELDLLYRQRAALDLGEHVWAWSSTEGGEARAWVQRLSDGYQGVSKKRDEYWLLPVRRVSLAQAAEAEAAKLREQRDALRAEVEALREHADQLERQAAARQAGADGWQAAYDRGRADGVKFRLGELEQERRIAAELQAVALRLIKTYITEDSRDEQRAIARLARMRREVSQ